MGSCVDRFSSGAPTSFWTLDEIKDKGIKFKIAPYYFQHIVQGIESKYGRQLPQIRVVLKDNVHVYRNDSTNSIEVIFKKKEDFDAAALKEVENSIKKLLENAESATDIKVSWWFYKKGDKEEAFGVANVAFLEKTYLYAQEQGKVPAKNNKLEVDGKTHFIFFEKGEINTGEIKGEQDEDKITITRKAVPITDHEADFPKSLPAV